MVLTSQMAFIERWGDKNLQVTGRVRSHQNTNIIRSGKTMFQAICPNWHDLWKLKGKMVNVEIKQQEMLESKSAQDYLSYFQERIFKFYCYSKGVSKNEDRKTRKTPMRTLRPRKLKNLETKKVWYFRPRASQIEGFGVLYLFSSFQGLRVLG